MSIGSGVNRLRILVWLVAIIGGLGPLSDARGYAETVDPERRSCFSEARACLSEFIHDPDTRFGSEGLQAAEIQHLWLAYGVLGRRWRRWNLRPSRRVTRAGMVRMDSTKESVV